MISVERLYISTSISFHYLYPLKICIQGSNSPQILLFIFKPTPSTSPPHLGGYPYIGCCPGALPYPLPDPPLTIPTPPAAPCPAPKLTALSTAITAADFILPRNPSQYFESGKMLKKKLTSLGNA
jgi:hypothetical protein